MDKQLTETISVFDGKFQEILITVVMNVLSGKDCATIHYKIFPVVIVTEI